MHNWTLCTQLDSWKSASLINSHRVTKSRGGGGLCWHRANIMGWHWMLLSAQNTSGPYWQQLEYGICGRLELTFVLYMFCQRNKHNVTFPAFWKTRMNDTKSVLLVQIPGSAPLLGSPPTFNGFNLKSLSILPPGFTCYPAWTNRKHNLHGGCNGSWQFRNAIKTCILLSIVWQIDVHMNIPAWSHSCGPTLSN